MECQNIQCESTFHFSSVSLLNKRLFILSPQYLRFLILPFLKIDIRHAVVESDGTTCKKKPLGILTEPGARPIFILNTTLLISSIVIRVYLFFRCLVVDLLLPIQFCFHLVDDHNVLSNLGETFIQVAFFRFVNGWLFSSYHIYFQY